MPNQQLLDELRHTFRQEAAEHLDTLNSALLQYERADAPDNRQAHIQDGFRAAHSLKGAARAVSLESVQTVAHAVETVFQNVRDHGMTLESDHCDTLYDALDILGQLVSGEDTDIEHLLDRLQTINSPEAAPTAPATPIERQPTTANGFYPQETIRVPLNKLDDLMAEVGELLVARISTAYRLTETRELSETLTHWAKTWAAIKPMLKRQDNPQLTNAMLGYADVMQEVIERFQQLEGHTRQDVTRLDMVTDTLQNKVRRVRMIPFSMHQLALERIVRDAARVQGKAVNFEIIGADTELDKRVLEQLKDPLVHLLRNAVGHGIEPPDARGDKPAAGTVTLRVWQRGSEVHITVSDDGRGFQTEEIQQVYKERYGDTDIENVVQMAFSPGVSTAGEVNEISGRGIGLDAVRAQLERVHGRFSVQTTPGDGTTIHLIVPTSLAITRILLVQVNHATYALPLVAIEKILVPNNVTIVAGKPMLRVDGRNLPLVSLDVLLGGSGEKPADEQLALVISIGDQRLAVLVDDVLNEQELAVKPIGFPVESLQNVTGAALLGTGDPVIVLNPADFAASYKGLMRPVTLQTTSPSVDEPQAAQVRVLVVDDSITTRTLERNILEAAGFDVITATNGVEALMRLGKDPVDVVVSDIEMPQMNGFDLTERIRATENLAHLPIILVTSLEREVDKERGMLVGADAYIVKRGFDQVELLTTIDRLV